MDTVNQTTTLQSVEQVESARRVAVEVEVNQTTTLQSVEQTRIPTPTAKASM